MNPEYKKAAEDCAKGTFPFPGEPQRYIEEGFLAGIIYLSPKLEAAEKRVKELEYQVANLTNIARITMEPK